MDFASVVRRHEDALDSPVHDEVIVTQSETGAYYSLDGTAKEIWVLLLNPLTVRSICDQISQTHGLEPSAAEPDILAFLGDLQSERLIRIDP